MAEWNKNKVLPSVINGGNEFTTKDNLAINELNAIVNNSFYASEKSERAEQLAESAFRGNGTIVTIGGVEQPTWSADFAESERQKSETDGVIVHKNDIADVEHRKVLYDKDSTDSIINLGQTGGYPISSTINVDYSNAKKLYIYSQRAPYIVMCEVDVSRILKNGRTFATGSTASSEYIVAHAFELFSTKDKINFNNGGYYYLSYADQQFQQEDSSSNNVITKIEVGY